MRLRRAEYQFIAGVIRYLRWRLDKADHQAVTTVFADALEAECGNFNREKFMEACGASPTPFDSL